MALERRMG